MRHRQLFDFMVLTAFIGLGSARPVFAEEYVSPTRDNEQIAFKLDVNPGIEGVNPLFKDSAEKHGYFRGRLDVGWENITDDGYNPYSTVALDMDVSQKKHYGVTVGLLAVKKNTPKDILEIQNASVMHALEAGLNEWYYARKPTPTDPSDHGTSQVPFLQYAYRAEGQLCPVRSRNHGLCIGVEGALTVGLLQAGIEGGAGVYYMGRVSDALVKLGPEIAGNALIDADGPHHSANVMMGLSLR